MYLCWQWNASKCSNANTHTLCYALKYLHDKRILHTTFYLSELFSSCLFNVLTSSRSFSEKNDYHSTIKYHCDLLLHSRQVTNNNNIIFCVYFDNSINDWQCCLSSPLPFGWQGNFMGSLSVEKTLCVSTRIRTAPTQGSGLGSHTLLISESRCFKGHHPYPLGHRVRNNKHAYCNLSQIMKGTNSMSYNLCLCHQGGRVIAQKSTAILLHISADQIGRSSTRTKTSQPNLGFWWSDHDWNAQ